MWLDRPCWQVHGVYLPVQLDLKKVASQQIVVKELYTTGCPSNDGTSSTSNDAYVILYNNSDIEADASNVVLGFLAPYNAHGTNKYYVSGEGEASSLIYEKDSWIPSYGAIWWFTAPVTIPAYSQIVVSIFGAIDFTQTYTNSVNLAKPEYYWMSNSEINPPYTKTVVDKRTGEPVEFATVLIKATEQWSVTDEKGLFSISGISAASSKVEIASLGYVTLTREIKFDKTVTEETFLLAEDNLTLESAVVTAQENANSATTSRTIDKTALEHVQVMNVSDIASLLPGGATENNNLIGQKQFNIRAGSGEGGNASFGTAVEVDGVRLSNTHGTRVTEPVVLTVGLSTDAGEAVTLHDALETLTFGSTDNVHELDILSEEIPSAPTRMAVAMAILMARR